MQKGEVIEVDEAAFRLLPRLPNLRVYTTALASIRLVLSIFPCCWSQMSYALHLTGSQSTLLAAHAALWSASFTSTDLLSSSGFSRGNSK